MKKLIFLIFLLSCGPVDTGSRNDIQPHSIVNEWSIYWWPGANATMQKWMTETVIEHDALLRANLNGEVIPRTRIHFYQTQSDFSMAYRAIRSSYGQWPLVLNLNLASVLGWAFLHPFDRSIHIWAGIKLEAHELGHAMLHVVIYDEKNHLDPRWGSFLPKDVILSTTIANRR